MASIEPTPEDLQQFLAATGEETTLVMINLLRYREQAEYPEGSDSEPCTGREAYQCYGDAVLPLLAKVGGRPIWAGAVASALISPEGETWDDAILVEYPTRNAFIEMTTSAEYQAIVCHRTAALEDSRLIATTTSLNQLGG